MSKRRKGAPTGAQLPRVVKIWNRGDDRPGNPQRFALLSCGHKRHRPKTCSGVGVALACLHGCRRSL